MNFRYLLLLLLCLSVASLSFAQSQAGLGSITGVVQDASGAAIPSAKVTISNESKGIKRTVETNAEGLFNAPSLVPAQGYSVSVNFEGFAPYERKGIEILVGQQINLTIPMSVAAASQQVEVTGGAPIVETTKTDVSQVVTENQITNLPINGRRVDSFVLLTPGVVADGTFGLVSFRGVAGGNNFLTDGNDTTNTFYAENAGRTRITTQISQDAVQEFQVVSNNFSAEFGRAHGGVINTVTKSGTNDLHGTAYWFFRNRSLNATDRYAAGYNAPEVRHQAGASLGGKIIQDKLFYFANFEMTRRDFPAINRMLNSNLFDRNGNFVAACTTTGAGAATQAQCDAAKAFVLRSQGMIVPREANSELGFAKLDYRPTERNSFSVSGNYLRWISPHGIQTQAVLTNGNAVGNNANSSVRTRYGKASWTNIISNSMVNEFRFGYFKDRLFDDSASDLWPSTGGIGLTVASQSNLGASVDGYPRINPSEQRFQLSDSLNWVVGRHTLKFGGDYLYTQDYESILRNRYGSYTYSTFTNFALDFTGNTTGEKRWQSFSQTVGNPTVDLRSKDYAAFIQDQFKVTRNLTLNLGVRYDFTDLPQPSVVNPAYPEQTGTIHTDGNNFAPRFGFAYAMGEKTVFRGGYGIFYQRIPGALLQTLFFVNGVYQPNVSLNGNVANDRAAGPVFPNGLSTASGLPTGSVDIEWADKNLRTPYTQQGNLGIERQLTSNLGLTVSYVWSHGVQLLTTRDLNVGPTGPLVTYRIVGLNGEDLGAYATPTYRLANRVDTRFRRITQVENGGQSWYNGLIVQLRKRYSHGLEANVSYTWSHAIDTANLGGGTNALQYDFIRSTFNGDYRNDKGTSQLDQRHRAVIAFTWQPTFTQNTNAFAKYIVNNWQLSSITTLASAPPATPTLQITNNFTGSAFTGSLNGLGGSNRVPFLPWNSLDIDQVYRVDARLSKLLPIGERFKTYLNFEAFNVFNMQYNTFATTQWGTVANGVITRFAAYGQGTQSQGFPDGTNARRMQASLRFQW